ncbi:MAG TPA: AAA family ATPase [Candidatus Dormibacteraeota bacterium]|nr:AAA family ATPase [Candidatus Dormibacteraeota bacterium]
MSVLLSDIIEGTPILTTEQVEAMAHTKAKAFDLLVETEDGRWVSKHRVKPAKPTKSATAKTAHPKDAAASTTALPTAYGVKPSMFPHATHEAANAAKAAKKPKKKDVLAEAKALAETFDKMLTLFTPGSKVAEREHILRDFLAVRDVVLMMGREKTEKSLFAERIGMHIACGKSWCGYVCTKPRKVSYLDAENDKADVEERYSELLKEFTPEEQALIAQNFRIVMGREYTNAGGSLDYMNDDWWDFYASHTTDAEIHILDCLYMFHDLPAYDNNGLQEVMQVIRYRLNYQSDTKTILMLNHARSMSNDDIAKVDKLTLKRLGVQTFSEQSYGGKVLKKNASVVVAVDRWTNRDEEGEVATWGIHFQFYGRRAPESPLLTFEPSNDLYQRRLVRELTTGAWKALIDLRTCSSSVKDWASMHEAVGYLSYARRAGYHYLKELVAKGYLIHNPDDERLYLDLSPNMVAEMDAMEKRKEAALAAKAWLSRFVTHPMQKDSVLEMGEREHGFDRQNLIDARHELELVEESQFLGEDMIATTMWRPRKTRGLGSSKINPEVRAAIQAKGNEAQGKKHKHEEPESVESVESVASFAEPAQHLEQSESDVL